MRRILCICSALLFLCIPARAAQPPRYAALVIDSGCADNFTRQLLEGLYDRGLQATFLIRGGALEASGGLAGEIWEAGHEIACHGYSGQNMTRMSRRTIAGELMATQALLPEQCPVKFLCPPGGCGDGVRQVAQARKLGLLGWSVSPETWPPGTEALRMVRDGDLIHLRDTTAQSVEAALSLIDRLMEADFQLCSVSQLAKARKVRILPGTLYTRFPPQAQKGAAA